MLKAMVFAVALAFAAPVAAQPLPADGPDAVANHFFSLVRSGEVQKAYGDVGRGTLMEQKKAELQNVTNQTVSALQIYGKIVDWEQISEDKWSPSYLVRNYLLRTERGAVFFNLHLFRSVNGWVIGNISFTDIPSNVKRP